MQSCARCGFVVYPAEKINCIDQVMPTVESPLKILFKYLKSGKKRLYSRKLNCQLFSDDLKIILNQTGLSRDNVTNEDNISVSVDLNI